MASFAVAQDLFGESTTELRKQNGTVSVQQAFAGKEVIALYFSASWCGPCKRFTPMLVDVYNLLKSQGRGFEVVFVSADNDEEGFEAYYRSMPWLAVSFDDTDLREGELPQRFGCSGIPHLVLVDAVTGKEITREGVEIISQFGPAAFPYSEAAINAALEGARQKLLEVVNDWSILGSEASPAEFRSKEAVAVLVGNSDGPAQHIAPRLAAAHQALGIARLSVVYIPHGVANAAKEGAFQATFPPDWVIIQRPENVLGALASVFGGPPRPCLAVFSGDAKTLFNDDASMMVYQLKATGFPWRSTFMKDFKEANFGKPGLKFLADARLVSKAPAGGVALVGGGKSAAEFLMDNDLVGLYFSAHWCGPCRGFTPVFAEMYTQLKANGKKVEVVFLSSDRDPKAFEEYFCADMPWLALDYAQRELKEIISMSLDVQGIPTLIWVNPKTGEMIMNGRETVGMGAAFFPWDAASVAAARSVSQEKRGVEC